MSSPQPDSASPSSVRDASGTARTGSSPSAETRTWPGDTRKNPDPHQSTTKDPVVEPCSSEPSTLLPSNAIAPLLDTLAQAAPSAEKSNDWPSIEGYAIQSVLGRGGMGIVYLALQLDLNRQVALKMILAGSHASPEEADRFRGEALAVARIQHPNIVQIYEVGEADGHPFLSLEYVDGGSLAQRLRGDPLPAEAAAQIIETLARAMHAVHLEGVIHRDLKPGNVLLTSDGVPKITDFGLAKRLDVEVGHTRSGAILGTPGYMAPEQAGGNRDEIGPATDVYALGAILYEMLTGRQPFRAETPLDTILQVREQSPAPPRLLNSKVNRDLEAICMKCLEKNPRHRYLDAASLADDLRRFLNREPITARSVHVLERLVRTIDSSHYDVQFRSWSQLLLLYAAIMLLEHLIVFAVTVRQPLGANLWILSTRSIQIAVMALLFYRTRARNLLPTSAAERQLWSIWLGYLLASAFLGFIMHRELEIDELKLYPVRALLAGLAFFAMGGSYWGRCYVFGLGFIILAILMPRGSTEAMPLEFGLAWSATLLFLGLRLHRLGTGA